MFQTTRAIEENVRQLSDAKKNEAFIKLVHENYELRTELRRRNNELASLRLTIRSLGTRLGIKHPNLEMPLGKASEESRGWHSIINIAIALIEKKTNSQVT